MSNISNIISVKENPYRFNLVRLKHRKSFQHSLIKPNLTNPPTNQISLYLST
jgi:hypothetical protein